MSSLPTVKYVVRTAEYKGSPTLSISEIDSSGNEKPYPFSFGKKKAKLILDNLEHIKKFIGEDENERQED